MAELGIISSGSTNEPIILVISLLVLELSAESTFPIDCLRVELSASPVGCYCFMPLMDGKEMPDKHVGSLWYSQSREW